MNFSMSTKSNLTYNCFKGARLVTCGPNLIKQNITRCFIKLHLEPAVKLVDRISEVNAFPLGQELSQLRPLLQTKVVSDKVSVDAVPPPLLGVVQDV